MAEPTSKMEGTEEINTTLESPRDNSNKSVPINASKKDSNTVDSVVTQVPVINQSSNNDINMKNSSNGICTSIENTNTNSNSNTNTNTNTNWNSNTTINTKSPLIENKVTNVESTSKIPSNTEIDSEEARRKRIAQAARAFALAPSTKSSNKTKSGKKKMKSKCQHYSTVTTTTGKRTPKRSLFMGPTHSTQPINHLATTLPMHQYRSTLPSNNYLTSPASKMSSSPLPLSPPTNLKINWNRQEKTNTPQATNRKKKKQTSIKKNTRQLSKKKNTALPIPNHSTQMNHNTSTVSNANTNAYLNLQSSVLINDQATAKMSAKNKDEELDEYAKFVKSVCDTTFPDDLVSLVSFPIPNDDDDDDDDEASYQLPDDEDDDDEFDDYFESGSIFSKLDIDLKDGNNTNDNVSAMNDNLDNLGTEQKLNDSLNISEINSSSKPNKNASLSMLIEKTNRIEAHSSIAPSSNLPNSKTNKLDTVTFDSPGNNHTLHTTTDVDDHPINHNFIDYSELEEELGNLMEEDIEATLATLLQQPIHKTSSSSNTGCAPRTDKLKVTSPEKDDTPIVKNIFATPSSVHDTKRSNSPSASKTNSITSASPSNARQRKHKVVAAAARATSTILPSSTLAPLTPTTKIDACQHPQNNIYNEIIQDQNFSNPADLSNHTCPSDPSSSSSPHLNGSVNTNQIIRLHSLMKQHYQLLLQQSILAIRTAHQNKKEKEKNLRERARAKSAGDKTNSSNKEGSRMKRHSYHTGETLDEITEILDGAVVMMQDLDQNRKDAFRNAIAQREQLKRKSHSQQRLTRSTFIRTLQERDGVYQHSIPNHIACNTNGYLNQHIANDTCKDGFHKVISIFDLKGLGRLHETFSMLDNSVNKNGKVDILGMQKHADACSYLLREASAQIDESLIPGNRCLSELLTFPQECLGANFELPLSNKQEADIKHNRLQFTASEDNLLLRGVNLFGEKEWILVSDRYLPDRSNTVISQRYSRLCFLLYIAYGIQIDDEGNLETPPEHPDGVENFDEEAISKLKVVEEPFKYNVHRWSLIEDITILKSVPLMGRMWAEISNRLIKHRDRGHIRKRYQVLERRVRGALKREKKGNIGSLICSPPTKGLHLTLSTPTLISNESNPSFSTPDVKDNKTSRSKKPHDKTKRIHPSEGKSGIGNKNENENEFDKGIESKQDLSRVSPRMLPMISKNSRKKSQGMSTNERHENKCFIDIMPSSTCLDTPKTPNPKNTNSPNSIQETPVSKLRKKSPVTILSSKSSYTPTHIKTESGRGGEELICDENMASLPPDSSLLNLSNSSKMFYTPSIIKSLPDIDTNEKISKENMKSTVTNRIISAKRSLKCSPTENYPMSITSNDFEKIMNENTNISMVSHMNKWMHDNESLTAKSSQKGESKMENDSLMIDSQNNSNMILEKLPNIAIDGGGSSFSILNYSKDAPKSTNIKSTNNVDEPALNLGKKKTLIQAVLGIEKKDLFKENDTKIHKSKEMSKTSLKQEITSAPMDISGLSFAHFNGNKESLVSCTATQMITGDMSVDGLSDFGITNFQLSERSMQVFQGSNNILRQRQSRDSATSATITECSQSVGVNNSNSIGPQSLFDVANALNSLSNSPGNSRRSIAKEMASGSRPKRRIEDCSVKNNSLFSKVLRSADGKNTKRQRKDFR